MIILFTDTIEKGIFQKMIDIIFASTDFFITVKYLLFNLIS